ncbi:MAG: glycosyltransferase [Actinomycetota bacterium]
MRAPFVVVHSAGIWLPVTETWLYNLISHLPESIESHVVCGRRANTDLFPFPRVSVEEDLWRERLATRRGLRRLLGRRTILLGERVRDLRPRILHSHFGYLGWRNLPVARRNGLRHVVSFYGVDLTQFPRSELWRRRYAELFAGADAILCEGPHMAGTLTDLGCPADRVRVHRLGVSVDRIPFRPRRRLPGEPLRVLVAATFREKKGIPDALACLAILAAGGVDCVATVIGDAHGPADAAEKERILAAAAAPALEGRVRFLGFQPPSRLMEEAYRHHVFLAPSVTARGGDAEGGAPMSVIEMAASGMPIVSTTHCDIPNVLAEPNRRLLAPERDPAALADVVRALAGSEWDGLTRANRDFIERAFDVRVQADGLARIYTEVAADPPGGAVSRPATVAPPPSRPRRPDR